MRHDTPSATATWVAALRGLGAILPDDARIADDVYGPRFAGRGVDALFTLARRAPALSRAATRPLWGWIAYLQVRTRAIDDAMLAFVEGGGRQIVILGAGYDCRAARFAGALAGCRLFEIDHPATQRHKRAVMADERQADVEYLAWDFEARPLAELPEALIARGLDPRRPTLTIWEGVTMYLSESAIDETLAAVRRLGAAGSPIAFTYFDRDVIAHPTGANRRTQRLVRRFGEPHRFGWEPSALPAWLTARGFALETDRSEVELAELLPPAWGQRLEPRGRHIAVARSA